MPSEVWGYRLGDYVEVRQPADNQWHPARVTGLTVQRTLVIAFAQTAESRVVSNPRGIRAWEVPTEPDDIERWLAE